MIATLKSRLSIFRLVASTGFNTKGARNCESFANRMSEELEKVPDVDIDPSGTYKYILVKISDKSSDSSKQVVRGYARAQWHADIFDEVVEKLKKECSGLEADCLGGGKILHDPDSKSIRVYSHSVGFGKADHKVAVEILKKKYTDYEIDYSDD